MSADRTLVATPDPENEPERPTWTFGLNTYSTGASTDFIQWSWNGWNWQSTSSG